MIQTYYIYTDDTMTSSSSSSSQSEPCFSMFSMHNAQLIYSMCLCFMIHACSGNQSKRLSQHVLKNLSRGCLETPVIFTFWVKEIKPGTESDRRWFALTSDWFTLDQFISFVEELINLHASNSWLFKSGFIIDIIKQHDWNQRALMLHFYYLHRLRFDQLGFKRQLIFRNIYSYVSIHAHFDIRVPAAQKQS